MLKKIALVTVLFNSNDVLEGFFRSLSIQTFQDFHLFIIDNTPSESTDIILNNLSEQYDIKYKTHIKNSENIGVARGNNQGINKSLEGNYDYTLLLNNDIEFYQIDLLKSLYTYAFESKETLVVPKILYFDTKKIWMAGGIMEHLKGTNIHVGDRQDDLPDFNVPKYFDYAPTCFMLINNNVFRQIGIMDEKYFVYYDDVDFIFRAFKNGHKVAYFPQSTVFHKVSSSTGGSESLFSIYYSNRNRIYFLRKNYRGIKFAIPFAFTLITRLIKFLSYNTKQKSKLYHAVIDGLKM